MQIKPGQTLIAVHVLFLALIIVPFLIWGDSFDALALEVLSGRRSVEIFLLAAFLLAADVFIPVPSSAVSVSAGMLLGAPLAFASCLLGLTLGCLVAYGFGYYFRKKHFNRWYGDGEFRQLSLELSKYGYLVLLGCRGIPILSEMSVMVAGFHRYPFHKFLLITFVANSILAAIYAFIGDSVHNMSSIYLLVATPLLIPMITYTGRLWWLNRLPEQPESD